MYEAKILLAEDESITRMDLREMLQEMGYQVAGEAADGWEAVQMAAELHPDVVLMDIKMPRLDGLVAAQKITDQGLGAVILLSAYSQPELVEKGQRAGVAAYLVKPVREAELLPAIEIALAQQRRLAALKEEVRKAVTDLESRKLVERAKGILMQAHSCSEDAAYRRLQRLSMDRRLSMLAVSQQIIAGH